MIASEPLFKFVISSLDFVDFSDESGSSRGSIDLKFFVYLVSV